MVHLAIVGITTVAFGIASLLLMSKARSRLSEGSIRRYMDNFAICLAFIVIFSVWQTTRDFFGGGAAISEHSTYSAYPEYIFVVFAYISFIAASYRVLKISEEFGFKEDGKRIEQIMRQKPAKKSKK